MGTRHTVVMVTTSYPRFPGDTTGTFLEPIAQSIVARGHTVHLVAPWHPAVSRPAEESGLRFHFYRYAPHPRLYVFGYSGALRADVTLRASAYAVAPLALLAAIAMTRRVAAASGATIVHGHWVVPSGVVAAMAAGRRPVVISLHGSDVYVAERHAVARAAARRAFGRAGWVTACSQDLRDRGVRLGAPPDRSEVIPYGVDPARFGPDPGQRRSVRERWRVDPDAPLVFAAGRLVRKKGFEYLIDSLERLVRRWPRLTLLLAGEGDLDRELRDRVRRLGLERHVVFTGRLLQGEIASHLAAADVAVIPSIRDDAGNVDGLPNVVLEALASATPVVTTPAGGIASVVRHGETGLIVPERDAAALASAIDGLLADAGRRRSIGGAARREVLAHHAWSDVAARFETVYDRCYSGRP